jgi:hypothetical protein
MQVIDPKFPCLPVQAPLEYKYKKRYENVFEMTADGGIFHRLWRQ